jgi:hypothetical protein
MDTFHSSLLAGTGEGAMEGESQEGVTRVGQMGSQVGEAGSQVDVKGRREEE